MVRVAALFAQGGIAGSAPILMMVAIFAIFYLLADHAAAAPPEKMAGDAVADQVWATGWSPAAASPASFCRLRMTSLSCASLPTTSRLEVARSSIVTLTTAEDAVPSLSRVAVSHEQQESPRQNNSDHRGADRLSVRHLRHSPAASRPPGLLARCSSASTSALTSRAAPT